MLLPPWMVLASAIVDPHLVTIAVATLDFSCYVAVDEMGTAAFLIPPRPDPPPTPPPPFRQANGDPRADPTLSLVLVLNRRLAEMDARLDHTNMLIDRMMVRINFLEAFLEALHGGRSVSEPVGGQMPP